MLKYFENVFMPNKKYVLKESKICLYSKFGNMHVSFHSLRCMVMHVNEIYFFKDHKWMIVLIKLIINVRQILSLLQLIGIPMVWHCDAYPSKPSHTYFSTSGVSWNAQKSMIHASYVSIALSMSAVTHFSNLLNCLFSGFKRLQCDCFAFNSKSSVQG